MPLQNIKFDNKSNPERSTQNKRSSFTSGLKLKKVPQLEKIYVLILMIVWLMISDYDFKKTKIGNLDREGNKTKNYWKYWETKIGRFTSSHESMKSAGYNNIACIFDDRRIIIKVYTLN